MYYHYIIILYYVTRPVTSAFPCERHSSRVRRNENTLRTSKVRFCWFVGMPAWCLKTPSWMQPKDLIYWPTGWKWWYRMSISKSRRIGLLRYITVSFFEFEWSYQPSACTTTIPGSALLWSKKHPEAMRTPLHPFPPSQRCPSCHSLP